MQDHARILEVARLAAAAGGEVLRHYWHEGVTLRDKTESGGKSYDLVSDADVESQEAVAKAILKAFPDHELLGEEDLVGDLSAEHLWVIDPLDGTNNFAHHIPHFAVSIAYFYRGQPVVGVIQNPITGDTYHAVAGQGAWFQGEPIQCMPGSDLSKALVGCGFYYDRGQMMQQTLKAIEHFFVQNIHGIRRFGTASLDLCHVARGIFGIFFEYKLSPWDFAAGQLVVQESGGKITQANGEPIGLEPCSVLAAAAGLYDEALQITKQYHP
ncbi:MAG: inositol monophosphatase [Rhodopirellula sp. TMED11]|nr:MAG: inositol monophosphatase [Rhodopirellula sp. TMED11]